VLAQIRSKKEVQELHEEGCLPAVVCTEDDCQA